MAFIINNKRRRSKLVAEINVVPYIDVMLVLLIVFMVATPLLHQGIEVDLPEANVKPIEANDNLPIIISIKADRSFYISLGGDQDLPESLQTIQVMIKKVVQSNPQVPIMVWGDKNVPYGEIIKLMSALQNSGASSVGLIAKPRSLNR